MNGFDEFAKDMERIRKDFEKEMPLIAEATSVELLAEVRKEIVRQQLVDTRDLLNSFSLGDGSNIFEKRKGGWEIEVGTSNPYAEWVNDGHWTRKKKGGWTRSANSRLTRKKRTFVDATHFFDIAYYIAEEYMSLGIQKRIDKVIKRQLGG